MANQYDITQGQLDRRQALMDALTQSAMQSQKGQMVGNVYVAPGLLSALTPALAVAAQNYSQQNMDQKSLENSQARQTAMNQELQGLLGGGQQQQSPPPSAPAQISNAQGTSSYAAGSQTPINSVDAASPLVGALAQAQGAGQPAAQPQSQLGLAQSLMTSQFPENQALGQKLFAAQMGRKPETFTPQTVIGPDGKPTQILQGNYGTQRPSSYNPAVDNKLSSGGEVYNPLTVQPGDKLAIRPPSQQNVTVSPTYMQGQEEKALSKGIGEVQAKRYGAALSALDQLQPTQDMLSQIQQLEDLPRISGTGADLGLKAARIGSIFGMPMPDRVVNAAQLDSIVKTQLLQFIRQGGRGITNEEGERFLEAHPNITQDPASAKALRIMLQNGADRETRRQNLIIKQIEDRAGSDIKPVTGSIPQRLPEPPVLGQGGKQPVRTGTDANGRRVIQYSDGSLDYAN